MGSFKLELQAVGGHGCNRTAKVGEDAPGCGNESCPDCFCLALAKQFKAKFTSLEKASLTHWPGSPTRVVDDLKGDVPKRVVNDFFNSSPSKE